MIMVPFYIPFFSLSLSSLYDFTMLMREFAHECIMAYGGLKIHPTKYLVLLLTKKIGFTSLKSRHTFSNTILYISYMLSWKSVASVYAVSMCAFCLHGVVKIVVRLAAILLKKERLNRMML